MSKSINYYKGQAFKLFTEQNNWKYQAIKHMLNLPTNHYASNLDLLNKWHNITIQLYNDSKRLYEALDSPLSFRAYRRASQLLDMFDSKVEQTVILKESRGI